MTHQQTIRIISPVLLTGLLSGVPVEATLAETGIEDAPTLPTSPLPDPTLPSIPAPPSVDTQEDIIQPTEQVPPAVEESSTRQHIGLPQRRRGFDNIEEDLISIEGRTR